MQTSLALTALFMGVVGGPHCVAMCGAALLLTSGWALWMGMTQPTGLWCA